jgi:hypothetical protein
VFVTQPLAIAAGAYLLFRFVFPSFIARQIDADGATGREQLVRASGAPLASGRCAGQLGEVRFSGPLLGISVFPAGLLIKPLFMRAWVVLGPELVRIVPKAGLFNQRLEVEHRAPGLASPLVLYLSAKTALARAIADLHDQPPTTAANPTSPAVPAVTAEQPVVLTLLGVWGLLVNVAMIGIGVFWMIPSIGFIGFAWTGLMIAIAVMNTRRFVMRRHRVT